MYHYFWNKAVTIRKKIKNKKLVALTSIIKNKKMVINIRLRIGNIEYRVKRNDN